MGHVRTFHNSAGIVHNAGICSGPTQDTTKPFLSRLAEAR